MNDRIRKLAREAGMTDDKFGMFFALDKHNEDGVDLEKFAQLIVRECVSTLNDMHLWQSVNNQNYPNSWHDAVDQGIDTIKEHFGVE